MTKSYDVFDGLRAPTERPFTTQASRVIAKFGGARALATLLGLDASTVYKWLYCESKQGTGGHIPNKQLRRIVRLARPNGVLLTDDDVSIKEIREPWVRKPTEK